MRWDPVQYGRWATERSRPFLDLVARVAAEAPRSVLDVGCGSGELTVTLAQRWPGARVRGVDSSGEMIDRAPAGAGVDFGVQAAEDLDATGVDVLLSNAALQWVPEHRGLLQRWAGQLEDDGWLAFQVPANFDAPSHRLMRELAGSAAWRDRLAGVLRGREAVDEPEGYLALMAGLGLQADVWQTRYLHVLPGEDPVLDWVRGTALRPVRAALDGPAAEEFTRQYAALLREAYPRGPHGTVFPFRRTFVVAHRAR